ncbi:MAG: SCO family protein [Arenimonas sp.]
MNQQQKTRGSVSRTLLLVLAAALAAGAGLYAARHWLPARSTGASPEATASLQPQLRSIRLISPPRALPAFNLRLSDGGEATPATLQDHWTVVFLGFTHCPDVCPTTLAELSKAQKTWATLPAGIRPRLLFVSVDPERDTPAIVGDYAHYFSADTLAASPTPEALAQFAQSIGMVYMKVSEPGGSYSMDHSATLVLLDPQGRQAGLIRPPLAAQQIADDLRLLAERAP